MAMRHAVIYVLIVLLAVPSVAARPRQRSPDEWRTFAEQLSPGAEVTVHLKDGTQVKGHVVEVTPDALRLTPKTRIPVADRDLAFTDITSIELQKPGMSAGKRTLLIVGISAAAILGTMVLIIAISCRHAACGWNR